MESKPLHDNLTWIQNVYAYGAVKKVLTGLSKRTQQYGKTPVDFNVKIEAGSFVGGLSMDFAGLDHLLHQI
jgi:hypothetical protein